MNEVRRSASQLLRSYSFLLPAALAGEDDVKAAGIHYVPRLESQNDAEFAACRARAAFLNAAARTAEGFSD